MKDPVDRAIRAIARRNSYALVWAQFGLAHLVTLARRSPTCSIEMVERVGIELRGKQAPVRLWAPVVEGVAGGHARARGEPVAD